MRPHQVIANNKRWIKAAILPLLLLLVIYWRVEIVEILSMIGDRDGIVNFIAGYGVLGPVVLSVILALQVFLAVIPGHAFMVAGGYIYGLVIGAAITQISTVIASQLAFLLSRRYGRPLVDRIAPESCINHWNKLAERQGGLFFFFSFILPIFPNDLMCFIAGLSTIKPRKFLLANFFGRLPCAIFVTLIGSHGFQLPLYFWILIVLAIIVLCLLWKKCSCSVEERFLPKMAASRCISPSC
jgi:uncharacterized membrane protein YdjX (TVP38/TMEM64 family)